MRAVLGDFRAGVFAATAPGKVPGSALLQADNCMIDDEGALRRRGGCSYQSNADFRSGRMTMLWDGYLATGRRTFFSAIDAGGATGRYGFLDTNDATPLTGDAVYGFAAAPGPVTTINGMAVLYGAKVYAGSRLLAQAVATGGVTGSATVTQGSKTVIISPGSLAPVSPDWVGAIFTLGGPSIGLVRGRYVIESVDPTTANVILQDAWEEASATDSYAVAGIMGLIGTYDLPLLPDGTAPGHCAAIGDRLLIASATKPRIYVSAGRNSTTGALRPWSFSATDYHDLPPDARILGMVGIRDRALVFTTAGIFVISGLAYSIVDPASGGSQRRVDVYSRDVVLAGGGQGIAAFRDALVVPASDDIYLLDGLSAPEPISRSARRDWRSQVKLGAQLGQATVFRGHYLLPILSAAGVPSETWAFRLDRPQESELGVVFPWTKWTGQGGAVSGLTVRRVSAAAEELWAAGASATGGRVLDVTAAFDTGATAAADANGTNVTATVRTRDIAGAGLRTLWRRLKIRYRLGAGGTVAATVYPGGDETDVSGVALAGSAPTAAQAITPFTWAFSKMCAALRVKLVAAGGTEFVVQELEVEAREPGLS